MPYIIGYIVLPLHFLRLFPVDRAGSAVGAIKVFGLLLLYLHNCSFFLCICCRMLEYSLNLQSVSFSAVRTVRVLRPLRAINRVPSEFRETDLPH